MNLYFDNASTSFPKPVVVAEAITQFITEVGGTYGRASYPRIVATTAMIEQCRDLIAAELGVGDPSKVFFTQNATSASNTILKGLALGGSRVLVSPMEHNAVIRPLQHLMRSENIVVELLPHNESGKVDCHALSQMDMNNVSLIIVNHQSNVSGLIQPIEQIVASAQSVAVMVDMSQSLGATPSHLETWGASYAIFTGHKSLLGPTGVGGFYALEPDTVATAIYGGTGSRSDSYLMPESYPDRFEAGTPNTVSIAGLAAALENKPQPQHTFDDFGRLIRSVAALDGITLHCATPLNEIDATTQSELFSITHNRFSPSTICRMLVEQYGIETRQGLHCAPLAHRTLGTFPDGTLRIAPSPYHTPEDFATLCQALKSIICR